MSNALQDSIYKYLRGEAPLVEALAALQQYIDSDATSGLSMGIAGLSSEQRARFDDLIHKFYEIRSRETDRLLDEARKAGRVTEISVHNAGTGKRKPSDAS